jgi:hypothetical protein
VLNIAFGTHSNLLLFQGGALFDITPTLALSSATLGAAPISTVNTSTTITVSQSGHPNLVGDTIVITGAAVVATVTINGTWTVTAVTTNTWTFTAGSAANATVSGGGSAVVVANQRAYVAGAIDGAGGAGYGTGTYSTGTYSSPSTSDFFPRTWSLAAWGQNLLASYRAGPICAWLNATGTPAAPLLNAPTQCNAMLVAPQDQVFALGCNQEVSGVKNDLCIRHSGIRALTVWNTNPSTTAQEYVLPGGGRIVSGRVIGKNLLIFTDYSLFLGSYVGSPGQIWRFDKVGDHCGLIGPNAAVVVGQRAFWMGPDLQFYSYGLGLSVMPVNCPIRDDFAANMSASQGDKVVASSTSSYQEIRFDYPDARDGTENSRYLTLIVNGPDAGAWARGMEARTAYIDAGPSAYPIAADPAGRALYQERGMSNDGAALSWFLQTADMYLDLDYNMMARTLWPDVAGQIGPMTVWIYTQLKPQSAVVTNGPYMMAAGDGKVDIRASGRLFRIRYEGSSTPAAGRFGSSIVDADRTSKR